MFVLFLTYVISELIVGTGGQI